MTDTTRTDPVFDAIFTFNEQIIGTEAVPLNTLSDGQFEWTTTAYEEEIDELISAREKQDLVGMVDATLDLIYFAVGTLKKLGLTREQAYACMMAVNDANMTKRKGKVAARGNNAEDAVKPEDFVPPEQAIGAIIFEGNG